MKLKFLGSGSAFNSKLGNTSAYIINGGEFILIDCGGDVFHKILSKKTLNNNDILTVNVFITHMHPDNIGSLGDLIFYCYYILHITVNVFCVDTNIENTLNSLGCIDCYNYIKLSYNIPRVTKKYTITPIKTNHVDEIISSGFLFEFDDETFYYSGDSYEIPSEVLDAFNSNKIDYLFQDTCKADYQNNLHMNIDTLYNTITFDRNKVYCMHLDDALYRNTDKIISYGFNIVQNDYNNVAIYAGSFDPITLGHVNVIKKASKLFDKIIIGVLKNSKKSPLFSTNIRKDQIEKIIEYYKLDNVEVKKFDGLTADFAKQNNANVLIRGSRNITDFEDEQLIASVNKKINSELETIILLPDEGYKYVSSSLVKEIAVNKGDLSWLLPPILIQDVENKF